MSKFLIISGRNHFNKIADALSIELEDVLVDCLDADVYYLGEQASEQIADKNYQVIFIAVNNFSQVIETQRLLDKTPISGEVKCAYIFGGYVHTIVSLFSPLRQRISRNYKALKQIDHIFTGVEENVRILADGLKIPVHYCPIAVDVLKIAAEVTHRPIAINGFGRQEPEISNTIADHFNRPGSNQIYFHTNFLKSTGFSDRERYRKMFWHILRQSKLSLAFDSLYYNPNGHAKHSFVGPRWYESLGAGNVVIGVAPRCPSAAKLLNWQDATIDLPQEPSLALDFITQILSDDEYIQAISRRNLKEMNRKHDWRHRISLMLNAISIELPKRLNEQLEQLDRRSALFSNAE